jgi:hypothetical protein
LVFFQNISGCTVQDIYVRGGLIKRSRYTKTFFSCIRIASVCQSSKKSGAPN